MAKNGKDCSWGWGSFAWGGHTGRSGLQGIRPDEERVQSHALVSAVCWTCFDAVPVGLVEVISVRGDDSVLLTLDPNLSKNCSSLHMINKISDTPQKNPSHVKFPDYTDFHLHPKITRWALLLSWPPHSPETVGADLRLMNSSSSRNSLAASAFDGCHILHWIGIYALSRSNSQNMRQALADSANSLQMLFPEGLDTGSSTILSLYIHMCIYTWRRLLHYLLSRTPNVLPKGGLPKGRKHLQKLRPSRASLF